MFAQNAVPIPEKYGLLLLSFVDRKVKLSYSKKDTNLLIQIRVL